MDYKLDSLRPIPTEYRGVKFRSKSEAIFARSLDVANAVYSYEPILDPYPFTVPKIHSWDFLVFKQQRIFLVEYKPSIPSDTYVSNLRNKLEEFYSQLEMELRVSRLICNGSGDFFGTYEKIKEITRGYPGKSVDDAVSGYIGPPIYFYLVYGSPFCENQSSDCCYSMISLCKHCNPRSTNIHNLIGINDEIARNAKSFRFDLSH